MGNGPADGCDADVTAGPKRKSRPGEGGWTSLGEGSIGGAPYEGQSDESAPPMSQA